MKDLKAWQVWGKNPDCESTLELRAKEELPEMESTKQLVKLISEIYKPGMRILDVGYNTGHYLRGIRRLDPKANYVGCDAYIYYIEKAKEIYSKDENAKFFVKDIFKPLFPDDPFDIVYCCNVLLHLPYFIQPVRNLINSTKRYCFIRTLLGQNTTIVKLVKNNMFDIDGEPMDYIHQNTYKLDHFVGFIEDELGCKAEVIDDEYNSNILAGEFDSVKRGSGTKIIDGKQVDGNIIFEWKFIKIIKG